MSLKRIYVPASVNKRFPLTTSLAMCSTKKLLKLKPADTKTTVVNHMKSFTN